MSKVHDYLFGKRKLGMGSSDKTQNLIVEWTAWYQNNVKKFHKYWIYDGISTRECDRFRLGMAKKVCEDWANLLLNEKVAIKAGTFTDRLEEILNDNNFRTRANQLIELTFALGTGAFVEYRDAAGSPMIDYIRASMIYPISWDNGDITECAFGSIKAVDEKECIYLMICRKGNANEAENPELYYIENKYLDAKTGDEVPLPEDIEEAVNTESEKPNFQIIHPNIVNNVDMDSPMGISVFGNAIDQIKGADLIYDSFMNEFILGRKRILIPYSAAKIRMQKDAAGKENALPVFDPNDSVYFLMPEDRQEDHKLTEVDMSIRSAEHEAGINKELDLISLKCGMGTGRYEFENGGVKTATEVISDRSDLYQNLQKNRIPVHAAVVAMVQYLYFLETGGEAPEVTIDFDDSIIEDTNTTVDRNINLVTAGLRSKLTAIMEINKCSEGEAKKELKRIAEEGKITGQDIDWTDMDNPDDEESPDEADEEEKEVEDEPSEEPAGGRTN